MSRASYTLTAALTCAGFLLAGASQAEQRPVVVELFTSQGCSSCPPADAIFSTLADHDDVIAIALHVDYWDYIGWKDEFGHPAHADRQRGYAAQAGRRSVYTPEMIVNGETDIVGTKPMLLSEAIAAHKETGARMALNAQREGGSLRITGTVPTGVVGPMEVHVLRVTPAHTTKITRGENKSKTFTYTNIAHDWRVIGTWDGQRPLDLSVEISGEEPVVVLVQQAGPGAIVAAAKLD